jgi:MFS family permease
MDPGRPGISIASAVGDTLTQPETLGLSSTQVGLLATVYLVGEVVGALVFGALSDRLGRRTSSRSPWPSTSSAVA